MKNYIYILLFAFYGLLSCESELIKEPPFFSEESIFESEGLTQAYMANLYRNMPFINLSSQSGNGMGLMSGVGMEYSNYGQWQAPNVAVQRTYSQQTGGGQLDYWPYSNLRDANYLLENIGNSLSLDPLFVNDRIAETKFLRAFMYFELVKRYGGVPLVTKVLDRDAPAEEMFPVRNTEKEIYDFIYTELNEAIDLFSDEKTGALGKADKYAALALQSRAMLYAASIAKNGSVQINGLVGIPAGDAESYYQKSYDASERLLNAGYSLYNKSSDKEQNYYDLFITDANEEVIFAEVFESQIKGHSFNYLATPEGFDSSWNANFQVFYDFVELFEFEDGSPNIERSALTDANTWDIDEFFGKRDPRLRASVFYPESTYKDEKIYMHHSTTYTDDQGATKTSSNSGDIIEVGGKTWQGAGFPRNIGRTSLLLRKGLDPQYESADGFSGQDIFVFRLGEIILNHAEAAFYLNKPDEALANINRIRERAGMPLRIEATEENIRLERQFELCFEGHRFWDLIRWRTAVGVMDGVRTQGLKFDYNLDTERYTITLRNATGLESNPRSFGIERYYLPISQDRISDNPNLIQNPHYE